MPPAPVNGKANIKAEVLQTLLSKYRTDPTTKNAAQIKDLVQYHKRTQQEARCHYPFTLAKSFFSALYLRTLASLLLVVASTKGSTKGRRATYIIGGGAILFLHVGIIAIGNAVDLSMMSSGTMSSWQNRNFVELEHG
ncbi:hypothetical protein FFLO_02361 [Filobasidium floriforme]|uniref:Uncharacterized protein n=1 Tax=Filobasidium floriforme TaxID=5210 RepID=A0A8K0JN18_9TREE|nr:uncharacterized protein HD553DRAFT_339661 [Filobasidium floriforme]KAG7562176.1 hypothetical protein FFLO_02361 [Filobasidium floriforme]KAH8088317.1 hypothetical protein HD553DRAFT_339661 [Filobasidium floriforme]